MTEVEKHALLPCPFCGSPAEIERENDHHGSWFNLGCSRHWGKGTDNQCIAGRLWYTETETPEAEAVAAWNRRSPDPTLMGALKLLSDEAEAADMIGYGWPKARSAALSALKATGEP